MTILEIFLHYFPFGDYCFHCINAGIYTSRKPFCGDRATSRGNNSTYVNSGVSTCKDSSRVSRFFISRTSFSGSSFSHANQSNGRQFYWRRVGITDGMVREGMGLTVTQSQRNVYKLSRRQADMYATSQ